jgi:acetyltransferase-like isoleucine patch superfamily enzyme
VINDYVFNNSATAIPLNLDSPPIPAVASFLISDDCQNFNFKVSTSRNNVGINIPQLTYNNNNGNPTNPNDLINNSLNSNPGTGNIKNGGGLLILQPTTDNNPSGANYTIQVAPIDINNVFLKDSTYTDSSPNINQVITTNVAIIGNLAIGRSSTTSGNIFALDVSGITNIREYLFVGGDVSLNANLFVNGDISLNRRLFVGQDVSLNSRLFVKEDVSFNSRLYVGGDVSLNSNVFVSQDVSLNRRLYVGQDVSLNANLFVAGDLSLNSRLFVGQDVSLNSRLFVKEDVSMNSRLFVKEDVSMNSR